MTGDLYILPDDHRDQLSLDPSVPVAGDRYRSRHGGTIITVTGLLQARYLWVIVRDGGRERRMRPAALAEHYVKVVAARPACGLPAGPLTGHQEHAPGDYTLTPPCVYVYGLGMAKATIYLDDSLAERVRQANVPISRVCQLALRAELCKLGASTLQDEIITGQMTVDDFDT